MKNIRLRNLIALLCNIASAVLVVYCMFTLLFKNVAGSWVWRNSYSTFKWFTTDSNILAAISCIIMIPTNLRCIFKKDGRTSPKALSWKFAGTIAVTVTFVVVMAFLGPIVGYDKMFNNTNLYFHLIVPLLCVFSLVFCEGGKVRTRDVICAVIPVLTYGIVYFYMFLIKHRWDDFYGFTRFWPWYISVLIIFAITLLFGIIEAAVHNRLNKRGR